MSLKEPLRFRPILIEKVWGGDHLAAHVEGGLPEGARIGEVWSLVDRLDGGSEVDGGTFDGRSLRGLMLSERDALLGNAPAGPDETFPLLVKLLDARLPLSVQVHPDRKTAARLGGSATAKDECWYVLSADEDCGFLLGLREGVEPTTFAQDAGSPGVVDLLQSFTAHPGQFVSVPAGTVHSIGAGVRLVEVQENSDTTLRLYDWDRPGLDGKLRECQPEEALSAIDYERPSEGPKVPELLSSDGPNRHADLLTTEAFAVELLEVHEAESYDTDGRPWIHVVLSGHGTLRRKVGEGSWTLGKGETWLLPADLGAYRIDDLDGELRLLRVSVRGENPA
jgi:mannose-6-phosphate isomerase